MTLCHSESRSVFHIRFKELVGEVLCEEGKHEVGALRVWNELSPYQELLCQLLNIGEFFFSYRQKRRKKPS